jgi:hypothetical protein
VADRLILASAPVSEAAARLIFPSAPVEFVHDERIFV